MNKKKTLGFSVSAIIFVLLCSTISHAKNKSILQQSTANKTANVASNNAIKLIDNSAFYISKNTGETFKVFMNKPFLSLGASISPDHVLVNKNKNSHNFFTFFTLFSDNVNRATSLFND